MQDLLAARVMSTVASWMTLRRVLLLQFEEESPVVESDNAEADADTEQADEEGEVGGDGDGDSGDDMPTWVQCGKCCKWRVLPCGTHAPDLTEEWLCSDNPDSDFASCDVAEEEWEEGEWQEEEPMQTEEGQLV
jgi:hypothetical protein